MSPGLDRDMMSKLTSVEELELANMINGFKTVYLFPRLVKLSVDNTGCGDPKHLTQWHLAPLLHLHILKILDLPGKSVSFMAITNWLLGMDQMPKVLHCRAYSSQTSRNRDALLQSIGSSLQSSHLCFGGKGPKGTHRLQLPLTSY